MKLQLRSLTKWFPQNGDYLLALEDVNITVGEGEFLCIVGPSGCGKTTLLNLVAGLEQPSSGEVLLDGRVVAGPGPDRALVFQEYALYPWLTVEQNIAFGLHNHPSQDRRDILEKYLAMVKLKEFRRSYPHQLSGGMKQRAALARALAIGPEVVLMDEPFAALDAQTRNLMQAELLDLWKQEQKTIIFVTHNVDEAVFMADRVIVMSSRPGRVVESVEVSIPRPRKRTSAPVNEVRGMVLDVLSRYTERATV